MSTLSCSPIIRPPWYERCGHGLGIFRSARPNDMVRAGVGRTFQNIRLFQNMTALENVLVGHAHQLRSNPGEILLSLRRQRGGRGGGRAARA